MHAQRCVGRAARALKFGGSRAIASEGGQHHFSTAEETDFVIDTGTIKAQLGRTPGDDPARDDLLKVGDRLTVKVLKAEEGQVLVAFGRFRAPALVDFSVQAGDRIQVLVAGMQDGKLRLQLADASPQGAGLAGQTGTAGGGATPGGLPMGTAEAAPLILPTAADLFDLRAEIAGLLQSVRGAGGVSGGTDDLLAVLDRITQNMRPLPLEGGGAELAPRIESGVDDYGVFFEKKLQTLITDLLKNRPGGPLWQRPEVRALMERDMKPNLLRMQRAFEDLENLLSGPAQKKATGVKQLLEGMLTDIEQQQDRAVRLRSMVRSLQTSVYTAGLQKPAETAGADTPQVFTYQFPLPNNESRLRLKVYYAPGGRKHARQGNRLSLLLSMGSLGDLRTDFFLLQRNLEITFYVADDRVRKLVQEHLSLLEPAVEPLFEGLHVRVLVSIPKIKGFEAQDWIRPDDRLVDYRV